MLRRLFRRPSCVHPAASLLVMRVAPSHAEAICEACNESVRLETWVVCAMVLHEQANAADLARRIA